MHSAISVTVRIRPFKESEPSQIASQRRGNSENVQGIVSPLDSKSLILFPKIEQGILNATKVRRQERIMIFDQVYGPDSTQSQLYDNTVRPLVDTVLRGINSTVFAYGPTGCGKTHTICGDPSNPGLVFRVVDDIFAYINSRKTVTNTETRLEISYLQIHNEVIHDLLGPRSPSYAGQLGPGLQLREGNDNEITVTNLSIHRPETVEDLRRLVELGNGNRSVSSTHANAVSSRSHAMLTLRVQTRERGSESQERVTTSTMTIVDLAGNERAAATQNVGIELHEGANINRSLLALGKCLNALSISQRQGQSKLTRTAHVPWRDSKLTRLLKSSLAGNCRTAMIVCVSPSPYHYEDTQASLLYASRAKNICTEASVNTKSDPLDLHSCVKQLTTMHKTTCSLKQELSKLMVALRDAVERVKISPTMSKDEKEHILNSAEVLLERLESAEAPASNDTSEQVRENHLLHIKGGHNCTKPGVKRAMKSQTAEQRNISKRQRKGVI